MNLLIVIACSTVPSFTAHQLSAKIKSLHSKNRSQGLPKSRMPGKIAVESKGGEPSDRNPTSRAIGTIDPVTSSD